jgi:hypothetical protein
MSFRDSLSNLRKDLKHRLKGSKHKPDRTEAESSGEITGPTDRPTLLADELEAAPADGSEGRREGQRGDLDRGEISQVHTRSGPNVEVATEGGQNRGTEQAHPSSSVTPTRDCVKPNGVWAQLSGFFL